jgi:tetraacyldisaccharide 4'-kinase
VDAVIVIGDGEAGQNVAAQARRSGVPVVEARLEADRAAASVLENRDVLAFAGIGRPEKFWKSLEQAGARIGTTRAFPDHHAYTQKEIRGLLGYAASKALLPVTTEKDWVRLDSRLNEEEKSAIAVLPVRLAWADETQLRGLVARISGVGPT